MLIGFGTTLFVGPALVYGILRMLERGSDHLVTWVVLFSTTQNVGGLMGSALLGTLQTIWTRKANLVLASDMVADDPLVAGRLAAGSASLGGTIADPALRAVQGGGLLGQATAQQASVIAFTDTFRFVALHRPRDRRHYRPYAPSHRNTRTRPAQPTQNMSHA